MPEPSSPQAPEPASPFIAVRDAVQRQHMLDLLREGFPNAGFDWAAAFKAPPGRWGHGLLLIADGAPQGCMLFFERRALIGGRERYVTNLSSMYIRPEYRRLAVRMVRTASSIPDTVYTTGSPIRSVQAICLRVGFRYVSHGSCVSVPLLNGLRSERGVTVAPYAPELVEPLHRQWIADHVDARHLAVLIRQGGRSVPTLWLRGLKVKGFPAVRLLFTTDHALLRAALPALHAHLLRQGIVGLYLPRVAQLADLRSARARHAGPSTVVKGDIADTDVDLLYTEMLYLPM